MGEVWSMYKAKTQCIVEARKEIKGQRKILCLNFYFLSIKYEFYFTLIFVKIVSSVLYQYFYSFNYHSNPMIYLRNYPNNICFTNISIHKIQCLTQLERFIFLYYCKEFVNFYNIYLIFKMLTNINKINMFLTRFLT